MGWSRDSGSRLYALTEAGIEVFSPAGRQPGVVLDRFITRRLPEPLPWRPGKRTLYVARGGTILDVPMLATRFRGRPN